MLLHGVCDRPHLPSSAHSSFIPLKRLLRFDLIGLAIIDSLPMSRIIMFHRLFQRLIKSFKATRWVWIVALILASLFWYASPEASARVAPTLTVERADIVIDGRPIFQVEPSGTYTAQQRAAQANRLLAMLAQKQKKTQIEVVEHNQQPIILADEQYLLTVTEPDANLNATPSQQAQIWGNQLERSLYEARLEREPGHTMEMAILSSVILIITTALHMSLGRIWRRSPRPEMYPASIKLVLARLGIWVIALSHISSLFPALRQRRYSLLNTFTTGIGSPIFSLGAQSYTLIDTLILIALMAGLFTLVRLSTRLLSTHVLKRTPLARGSREVITQSFRYGAFSLGMLLLLKIWGIDLRSVALLGSALGIGIGFGLQDIAKNFGSGLVLLFERSVQVGDFIEVDAHTGVVERIGARSITLRTLDNISVLVPNAHLLDSQVVNWNHDHPVSRLHLSIGTAYEADSRLVKSLLLQAAKENSEVLPAPAPDVFLNNFGDSAIEFDLMVWIRHPERHAAIRSALNFRIEELLNYHEISIPFPQRDVNLRAEQIPITFPPDVEAALLEAFGATKKADKVAIDRVRASYRA